MKISILSLYQEFLNLEKRITFLEKEIEERRYYSSSAMKKILGCSESTLYRLRTSNKLKFIQIGSIFLYPSSVFDDLLDDKYKDKKP